MQKILNEKSFYEHVDVLGDCWTWLGATTEQGYGRCSYFGKSYPSHRLSLIFFSGEDKGFGWLACHTCFNKPCVNPNHLYWGTQKDNNGDRPLEYPEGTFKGKCKRGHDKQGHRGPCKSCVRLYYIADRLRDGKALSPTLINNLKNLGIEPTDSNFQIIMDEYKT